MIQIRLNVTIGLALLTLLLTPVFLLAADSAVVVPFFLSQKSVTTGTAISGKSTNGMGLYGFSSTGYGVWGQQIGTSQGKGYGGIFTSNTGIGLYGSSTASPTTANAYTPGVYGHSTNGYGVYGTSDSRYGGAFKGPSGITAVATEGSAGYFYSYNDMGINVQSDSPASSQAYAGKFYSQNYRGIYASSPSSYYAGYFENRGGSGYAGLYVNGSLSVTGSKSGYVVDIAINDGPDSLETGDLVIVTGSGEPVTGDIPLLHVRKSTDAVSSAIVGVVDQPFTVPSSEKNEAVPDAGEDKVEKNLPRPAASSANLNEGTGIAPGEYLSIVTLGSFKAIKADAGSGPIVPGSLLVASPEPGHVMAADSPACGTVVGKALGGLDSGTGLIPVIVSLQ